MVTLPSVLSVKLPEQQAAAFGASVSTEPLGEPIRACHDEGVPGADTCVLSLRDPSGLPPRYQPAADATATEDILSTAASHVILIVSRLPAKIATRGAAQSL